MEDRNQTVAELIADLQNQLDKANNRIEGLVEKNNNENTQLRSKLDAYQIKYEKVRKDLDKEKQKHERATEMITHLKRESNVSKAEFKVNLYKNALNTSYGANAKSYDEEKIQKDLKQLIKDWLYPCESSNND